MIRVYVSAFVIACLFTAGAQSQQRVQNAGAATPPAQLGLQAQQVTERESAICTVQRIWTARNGLLIDCSPPSSDNLYMAYDGGSLPGGIAAAMTLVTYADGRDEALWIDYQLDPGNEICATVQASPSSYSCARVISMGVFTPE